MQPNPFVMQADPQLLHYASVLYVAGALEQEELLETQAAGEDPVPWQGPSFAVNVEQVSDVP